MNKAMITHVTLYVAMTKNDAQNIRQTKRKMHREILNEKKEEEWRRRTETIKNQIMNKLCDTNLMQEHPFIQENWLGYIKPRESKKRWQRIEIVFQWIFMLSCPSHRIFDTMNYFEWRRTQIFLHYSISNTSEQHDVTLCDSIFLHSYKNRYTFRISPKSKWILAEILYRHIIQIHICEYSISVKCVSRFRNRFKACNTWIV